jgi:nitrogen regulatory protein P-II 1
VRVGYERYAIMKEIKVIIQPGKLEKVRAALTALPEFPGMTVTRVEGCGPAEDKLGQAMNVREQLTDFSPKVRLEIVVPDEIVNTIVTLIHSLAHTGHAGDGVIWVTPVDHFGRIRFSEPPSV